MKASSLLFSLPLLLHSAALQAMPPLTTGSEDPALGKAAFSTPPEAGTQYSSPVTGEVKTLRIRNGQRKVEIMTDQFHVRRKNGGEDVVKLSGKRTMNEVAEEARVREFTSGGDRADIVAYVPGRPKTDKHKMLITRRVTVRLAGGVVPSVFARTEKERPEGGAIRGQRISFANDALILTYASAAEAIAASERLLTTPGVLDAQMVIAVKRTPDFIPNVQFFSYPSGPEYSPRPNSDNVEGWLCFPDFCTVINTSAYQWWANNQSGKLHTDFIVGVTYPWQLMGIPANHVDPARADLGDFPAIGYVPAPPYAKVHGELSDVRLPVAWETPVDTFGNPVSGRGKKILIIDDGIQRHDDLLLALDLNPSNHFNYIAGLPGHEPQNATDPHGTSLAGLAGARIKHQGSRIAGVAPNCIFQGAVALKEYLDDLDWAQAFAQRSKLEDTNADNDIYDEERTGLMYFDICLNASSQSASQDGLDLYPEDWLWKRAIQFGAITGRGRDGIIYVTSAGNGGDGHMDVNYSEQKNCIYQIPVGGVSDLGRRISYSNSGAALVCVAPTWGEELPPLFRWGSEPTSPPFAEPWPRAKGHIDLVTPFAIRKNPPVEVHDLPRAWRRLTQGIPTITTNNGVDFNFTGTSASAAQVAGVVALMLEVNPKLTPRDVKEILLRTSRVCNDCRLNVDNGIHPTQWRMGPLGRPFHSAFGAGLVDANRAVQVAEKWPLLPVNTLIPQQLPDVTDPEYDDDISRRATETGGQYFGVPSRIMIPVNLGQTTAQADIAEILLPPPFTNMRLEHIEVRVRFYHKRRGDLEITLMAPPELGWDEDQVMESRLFEPHREDYTDSTSTYTDWTFTTVRHWGTRITGENPMWKLRVRDVIKRDKTLAPNTGDPAYVPVDNAGNFTTPVLPFNPQSQRMFDVGITYHGVFPATLGNDPPVIENGRFVMGPGTEMVTQRVRVEELGKDSTGAVLYPVTNWDFFNSVDISPVQPSNPPRQPFEFFPPAFRDPNDPNVLIPLENGGDEWPNQPRPPVWIRFDPLLPEPLVSGSSGGLTQQPAWGPDRTPVELSPGGTFIVLRDESNNDPATNYIYVRLHRQTGEVDVVPLNIGRYNIKIVAENLLGISKPKTLQFNVARQMVVDSWQDFWWPGVTDPAIIGWNADPDHDGLENGLEYMMRRNPTLFDSSGIPAYRIEGNEVIFTYQQDTLVRDGILHAQISDGTLDASGYWIWSDVPATMTGETGGLRDMEVRVPIADERIFFRLYAEEPTPPPAGP